MTVSEFGGLGVVVSFETNFAVIALRGEVDLHTAPKVQAAMSAMVDHGHVDIILDLAGLTFMDASGLRVIAEISARLSLSDHVLVVRSPPLMTHRILVITRLDEVVRVDAPPPPDTAWRGDRLGLRPSAKAIDAALQRVTELVAAAVGGADGVSITLERNGRLMTVAASNETVLSMDGHQYETGEGPCLSAATDGLGFHIPSLADEQRWPEFVPLAIDQGIASILSTPLMTVGKSIGALNIYSNEESVFGTRQQELASLFASHASVILAESGPVEQRERDRLSDALASRQTISRAQGVLMARGSITADEAASAIHRAARSAGMRVARYADAVLASTRDDEASS